VATQLVGPQVLLNRVSLVTGLLLWYINAGVIIQDFIDHSSLYLKVRFGNRFLFPSSDGSYSGPVDRNGSFLQRQLYRLCPAKYISYEDGNRIQSSKRCVIRPTNPLLSKLFNNNIHECCLLPSRRMFRFWWLPAYPIRI
jgi:hypothetical protein